MCHAAGLLQLDRISEVSRRSAMPADPHRGAPRAESPSRASRSTREPCTDAHRNGVGPVDGGAR